MLGLELTAWAHHRGKGAEVVGRLLEFDWPMHLFVCELSGTNKALKKKLKALPGTDVPFGH